jgi:hypothetical protein
MLKSLVLGTILGGVVAFIWSSISWEVLPWHEQGFHNFQNDEEVSAVIASHITESGNYILPGRPPMEGMNAEQKKALETTLMAKMQKGPIMFAAIRRGGFGSFAAGLIKQFLILAAGAFLLTWLLLQTSGLGYGQRVIFLAVAGLAASVVSDLPNWNWWGFSGSYTAVMVADSTLTWLFAGLVVAKVARGKIAS